MAFNLLIFGLMTFKYGQIVTDPESIYNSGGMFGAYFFETHQWTRLITPAFVHIGIQHLVFNMIALYSASTLLEDIYGSIKTLLIYFASAIMGNIFAALFTPTTVVAGASTSIFGMFAVLATLSIVSQNNVIKNAGASYLGLIIINLVYNLVTPGVSIAGHIGGALGGVLATFMFSSKYEEMSLLKNLISTVIFVTIVGLIIFVK